MVDADGVVSKNEECMTSEWGRLQGRLKRGGREEVSVSDAQGEGAAKTTAQHHIQAIGKKS